MKFKGTVYVVLTLSLFLSLASSVTSQTHTSDNTGDRLSSTFTFGGLTSADSEGASGTSLRGLSRLLAQYNPRAAMTCNNFPRICRAKGSPGPDCCKKQCVNVMTDGLNCGQCGKKCKYGEVCCRGNCVNVMYDRKNCGGCHRRCKKGSYCRYGMCSYA